MRRSTLGLICIYIILGCSGLAGATEYFVCNQPGTGSGTLADPYRMGDLPSSIDPYPPGPACSILQPGDTLTFLGGLYTFATRSDHAYYGYIHPVRSGTAAAPITFRAKPGDTVILRTVSGIQTVFGTYAGGEGMSYIRFVGFYAEQNEPYVSGERVGALLYGGYNEVAYCQVKGQPVTANDNYVGFRVNGSHQWIHHCEVLNWNSTNKDSISGAGVQAYSANNLLVEHNYFHDNNVGMMDKQSAVSNLYDSNYVRNNSAYSFCGSNQGTQASYTVSNNVLAGVVEMHSLTTGAAFHDNLIIDCKMSFAYAGVSAYAEGVYQTSLYNNIVFCTTATPSVIYAFFNPRVSVTAAAPYNPLSYCDYNAYQVTPVYSIGLANYGYYSLAQMRGYGFELHATVASLGAMFTDTIHYQVKAPYTTAGRYGDCLGPDNDTVLKILDTTRYGPAARPIPTALADSYTTNVSTQLVVADPGLLLNDTTAGEWALSAVKLSNPSHGTLVLSSTGGFVYTPTTGYTGTDSFTYQAKNPYAESATTTVTITIVADMLAGDATGDGYVDGGDLNILLSNWNATNATRAMGDLTGDEYVDGGDLNILLSNWNAGTPLAGNTVANTTVSQTTVDTIAPSAGTEANTFNAQINFQPASVVAPHGCLVDSGMPFSKADNGYSYGWTTDMSSFAVQCNNAASLDVRYDTAIMLVSGGTWEMAVSNGMYDVKIVGGAGDSGSMLSQKFTVEGVPTTQTQSQAQSQSKTAAGWSEETVTVVVTDGNLTIVCNPGSSICFVQITGR
jgi:hypothetical protein